jgi:hypothetical protein
MKRTSLKPDNVKAQENACWKKYRQSEAREAAEAKKQMEQMQEKHDVELRVEELAADIPAFQAEATVLEDRKEHLRKRREITAAKKQATAKKASKAKAEYDARIQKALNAGKILSRSVKKGVKSLEKKGAKFAKA